ncbi:Farnesol dehydrogenase [Lucilia cuprina]|nr:Farnesol dehydrogenase [Lucilia cuprina]
MELAVVTGASSGIGAAIVGDLLNSGLLVVGLARRVDRVNDIKQQLPVNLQPKLMALQCDVSSLESVNKAFDKIISLFGGVDVLVNNAGCMSKGKLSTGNPEEIQKVLQTNVMGVVYCTQRAFKSMKERNFDGHVILLNSISGHRVRCLPNYLPDNNIYAPSKFAITAITEIYRQEFKGLGTRIKITSISPGATETEIIPDSMKHTVAAILKPEDISQGVVYVLSTPPHVQIHEMIIKPVGEIYHVKLVAVVTGASSGIGSAIVKDLLKAGVQVVGLARRMERVEELKESLPAEQKSLLTAIKCDVSNQQSVNEAFDEIIAKFGGVDILVNNAGCAKMGQLVSMDVQDIQNVLQTNVMGIVYCTQRAFKSMKERNVDGHVVLINSVAGHNVFPGAMGNVPTTNIYSPSKFAVTAITEIYRQEFKGLGTKVKVTSVSPGLVDTEIVSDPFKQAMKDCILNAHDISNAVLYTLSTPPHVQIHEITIKPIGEIF